MTLVPRSGRSATLRLDQRIAETIEHARAAPFYRKALARVRVETLRDLARVPLLDKETAAAQQERLVVPGVEPAPAAFDAGVVSSATTRTGRPLRILRAADELPAPSTERDDRVLSIYSPRHGVRAPEAGRVLLPAVLHANTADVVDDLLSRGRFDVMVIPLSTLKWVTVALRARGRPLAAYGVREIGATGYRVTPHARAWLGKAWGAMLVDNYSLSELAGFFHPCRACGSSHWHGAPTWHELIDPTTSAPTRAATGALGELVCTTLLPHGLRMPLLRYRTGDIVELGPVCRDAGARGVAFRGRASTSLFIDGRPAVLSGDLQDAAEALPDVAMEPHPAEVLRLVPPSDLGVPKARVRSAGVDVELRYDPAMFPTRAAEVSRALRASFRVKTAALTLLAPGALDFTREARKL